MSRRYWNDIATMPHNEHNIVPTNRPPDSTALNPKSYLKKIQVRPWTMQGNNTSGRYLVGSLLYYAWAVDLTILFALSAIAQEQANPTDKTMQRVKQLLDYMHSNPMAKIRF